MSYALRCVCRSTERAISACEMRAVISISFSGSSTPGSVGRSSSACAACRAASRTFDSLRLMLARSRCFFTPLLRLPSPRSYRPSRSFSALLILAEPDDAESCFA